GRRLGDPAVEHVVLGHVVVGGVQLDRAGHARVRLQEVARRRAGRVELADPVAPGPGGRAERKPRRLRSGARAREERLRARGLGRTAEKLEQRLAACARLRAEAEAVADASADAATRARIVEEHERVRVDAKLHFWYLVVQRESVGITDHGIIQRMYPMPARLR